MEIFISAVVGELATRSLNFLTSKISKPRPVHVEDRLRRVLLRAQVIVDEAMGRHITNQAMLLRLNMVRDAMYRGYYTLDTFTCQSHNEERKDKVLMRHSSSLSMVNSIKFLPSSSRNTAILIQLQENLDDLSSLILDVQELVMFLTSYPRMYRQPYSMHLQLANCMFGFQMEAQFVINFLLHPQPHGTKELDVLPIFGPTHVGKSTLVAHVCKDERVRGHFSEMLFFSIHGFTYDELATFRQRCAIKHQNRVLDSDGRLLVVIELIWDLNEDAWNRLYSASKQCIPNGSKMVSHILNFFSIRLVWEDFVELNDFIWLPTRILLSFEFMYKCNSSIQHDSCSTFTFTCILFSETVPNGRDMDGVDWSSPSRILLVKVKASR